MKRRMTTTITAVNPGTLTPVSVKMDYTLDVYCVTKCAHIDNLRLSLNSLKHSPEILRMVTKKYLT